MILSLDQEVQLFCIIRSTLLQHGGRWLFFINIMVTYGKKSKLFSARKPQVLWYASHTSYHLHVLPSVLLACIKTEHHFACIVDWPIARFQTATATAQDNITHGSSHMYPCFKWNSI
jgi:hypothetical protein